MGVISVADASLEPAAPKVGRSTMWIGTVERGTFERKVRGHGKLVPEQLRWVQAQTAGRVEMVHAEPGQGLAADDVILELSNPERSSAPRSTRKTPFGALRPSSRAYR